MGEFGRRRGPITVETIDSTVLANIVARAEVAERDCESWRAMAELYMKQSADLRNQLDKCHAVLEQCQDCIRGETPEYMTEEAAREDTISKIREVLLSDD